MSPLPAQYCRVDTDLAYSSDMPNPKWLLTIGLSFLMAIGLVLVSSYSSSAMFSLPDGPSHQATDRSPRGVERFGNLEVTDVRSPIDIQTSST
ncbi:MAG: hypothetical protein WBA10_16470 [Elainellaceae cyanobacterium]